MRRPSSMHRQRRVAGAPTAAWRRFAVTLPVLLLAVAPARADDWNLGPFVLGGRAEFTTRVDRDAGPFPWNDATHSLYDRTRLMLDVTADTTRFGSFYIKGAALWDDNRPGDRQKKFRFEQGDYLWADRTGEVAYAARVFGNERRFFVEDGVAPLIHNDAVASAGENRGVRLDGDWRHRLRATAMHTVLGEDLRDDRAMSYAAVRCGAGPVDVGVSYLFDDMGRFAPRNQASLKVDAAAGYRNASLFVAYQQLEQSDGDFFLPGGRFAWDGFSNFQSALPDGGAFVTEARVTHVPVGDGATGRLVYRYEAAGRDFLNDLGWNRGDRSGHTVSGFLQANAVDLNGRLRYHTDRRYVLSSQKTDVVEGKLWGALRAGIWFILRGAIGEVDDGLPGDNRRNLLHIGAERRIREVRGGVHVMWRDLGTDFAAQRFAIDGKFPISSDWGLYSRVIASRDFDVARAALIRIDYRPNDRIFATFTYGREDIGNGPYMIEDFDVDLARAGTPVYQFMIRGDF